MESAASIIDSGSRSASAVPCNEPGATESAWQGCSRQQGALLSISALLGARKRSFCTGSTVR